MPEDAPHGQPTHELRIGGGLAPPPPRRRNRLKVAVIALWVTVAVAAAGVAGYVLLRPEKPITVSGTLTLGRADGPASFAWNNPGKPRLQCMGVGGYADITAGASVVIRDDAGKTVAVGQLDDGTAVIAKDDILNTDVGQTCAFPFTVRDVPARDFYSIEVTRRGPVTYPRAKVEGGGVHITLGN